MKDFIMKNKRKILFILAIAILVAIVGIYAIANLPKKVAIEQVDEEIKASVEEVPEGYVGITDAQGLKDMANDLAGNYILMADIDMEGEEWTPIGLGTTTATEFTGIFEGNYHTISNLTINSTNQYVGMFGSINGGTVQNLILENANITGAYPVNNYAYIGGIAGYSRKGMISNIKVSGIVTGKRNVDQVGGIVGNNYEGTIMQSKNSATVIGGASQRVGGIVGLNRGTITSVQNNGDITGARVGGIVGYVEGGTITEAINNGTVTGSSLVGGISGEGGTITKAENYGTIIGTGTGLGYVGGIAGRASTMTEVTNNGRIQRR